MKANTISRPVATHWNGPHFRPFSCGMAIESKLLPKQALFLDAMEPEGVWIYTLEGYGTYKIDQKTRQLRPGTVFAVRKPHQGWLVRQKQGLPWKYLWIHVTGPEALHLFDFIQTRFGPVQHLNRNSRAVSLARQLILAAQRTPEQDAFYWSEKTFLWLMAWWQAMEEKSQLSTSAVEEGRQKSRLLSFAPGSMKNFAEQMGYSRSHLTRRLTAQWGTSPGRVLREVRMKEAARLLRDTNLSVNEIAEKIGFSATASFSRSFAAAHQESPLAFRHRHRSLKLQP